MKFTALLILAALVTACTKEDHAAPRQAYTYSVQCDSCLVTFLNPLEIAQRDTAIGNWEHTVFTNPGNSLRVTAVALVDSLPVRASIHLGADELAAANAIDSVSVAYSAQ